MRVGIIGAGIAGLSAAWLLQPTHEVMLFEKNSCLGGHAHTQTVHDGGKAIPVDTAFQHLSIQMYPAFVQLLSILDVETTASPVTATLYSKVSGKSLAITPLWRPRWLVATLRPTALSWMTQLYRAIRAAAPLEMLDDWGVSVQEFVDAQGFTPDFLAEVLYPFLSGLLGTSLEDTRSMSARAAMKYPVHHRPTHPLLPFRLLQIKGGARAYVDKLASALDRSEIRLGTAVQSVQRERGRFIVVQADGARHEVDHVVIAAPARDAAALLDQDPGAAPLRRALSEFKYIKTSIAVHSDTSYMPVARGDWSSCNFIYDGACCETTIWSGCLDKSDVFKSWVTHGSALPKHLHGLYTYYHPLMTPEYFQAQRRLGALRGEDGLWIIGSYTEDIDSHESGLRSAIKLARRLSPSSRNLKRLVARL